MLNIELHKNSFLTILREIYNDPQLRSILGFKGGTAAMLFYALPRFSVDLDFDLLDTKKKELVFKRLNEILSTFGTIADASEKYYTLFFLLNYKKGASNLKIEISKRPTKANFVMKNYLGVSMLVMDEADMAAGKLAALLTRNRFAIRDAFDVWFFLKNNWPMNEHFLMEKTGIPLTEALEKAQEQVLSIQKTELLRGIGELLDNKQKAWVKTKLQDELVFLLKLYASNHASKSKK